MSTRDARYGGLEPDTESKSLARRGARIETLVGKLMDEASGAVYVDGAMARADLKSAERVFASRVKMETRGVLRGEIRGYDAEGDAPTSGDMRDTWALTIVDPKTNTVVDYWHFAPLSDPDEFHDTETDSARELVASEQSGSMTHERAIKRLRDYMQMNAATVGTYGVEMVTDSLGFGEMFPKYKEWMETHHARVERPTRQFARRPQLPRTFKRPIGVRPYWRRGMTTYVEQHQREHPRRPR